ncbi:hypothetical protein NL108_011753, partial [Boleophthalmus pectinirostris]
STLSLGSSASLRSQLSSNISKSFDILSILTHILGRSVSRGNSEFICGKCVSVLERVFKYDTVIARVHVLSSERLQKLIQERDKIRQWVRNSYTEKNPHEIPSRGSTSEEEGESEKDGYREMLRDNMALSEYEFWSEKWDTCPFFIRTGKRCQKGKGCEGCNALRVSDSDYESVCGIPRNLPFHAFSSLAFSRDKSRSMPLDWQKSPSASCSSPASLAGSTLSLPSRTESVQSLDSLDGKDPFDSPQFAAVNLLLKEISDSHGNALVSPAGSRIPVLDRRGRGGRADGREHKNLVINRVLDFENGEKEEEDMLMELRDEFVPLHGQNGAGRPHQVVKLLRAQLDQARTRIKTLEDQVQNQVQDGTKPEALNGFADWNNAALDRLEREVMEEKQRLEQELETLRKTSNDRERDLNTLQTVLQANQDLIQ